MTSSERFLDVAGRSLQYERVGVEHDGPPLVFLHEGLGSVELWRDFPYRLARRSRHPGLVYARQGNGWSSPLDGPRRPDYMHVEALEVLPRVIAELVPETPVLVGHSDGASIAIVYAGAGHAVERLVLIAPHVFVEPETTASIAAIRSRFPDSDMPERMAKYHTDPDGTFYGWADIWLSPAFRPWNIEEYLPGVACPTLLIQGSEDEYGTLAQLDAIENGLGGPSERLLVSGAGHSPHISHAGDVVAAVTDFIERGR